MKKAGLLVCPSRLAPQSAQRYRPADAQPWPAQPEGSAGSPASAGRLDGGGGPVRVHAQASRQGPQGDTLGPSRGALLGCHAWSRTRLPDLPSGGLSSVVRLGPRLVQTIFTAPQSSRRSWTTVRFPGWRIELASVCTSSGVCCTILLPAAPSLATAVPVRVNMAGRPARRQSKRWDSSDGA